MTSPPFYPRWSAGRALPTRRAESSHDKKKPETHNKDGHAAIMGLQMYSLRNAKEEIDAVAKHAMDLADHVLSRSHDLDSKLERLKTDILNTIDAKFADLQKTILGGEDSNIETSAVADLGAKISLLIHGPAEPAPHVESGHDQHDNQNHDQGHGDHGHSNDGWHQNDHH